VSCRERNGKRRPNTDDLLGVDDGSLFDCRGWFESVRLRPLFGRHPHLPVQCDDIRHRRGRSRNHTDLSISFGVAVDTDGDIYATNDAPFWAIMEFAPTANGNVAPTRAIADP